MKIDSHEVKGNWNEIEISFEHYNFFLSLSSYVNFFLFFQNYFFKFGIYFFHASKIFRANVFDKNRINDLLRVIGNSFKVHRCRVYQIPSHQKANCAQS